VDKRLRDLQRRFAESGTVEDEAAMLREAVRAGILTSMQLELAAKMEHPASLLIEPTIFRPFQGGGVPQYDELEDFLFDLFVVRQDLPYRLGLAYLQQTLPIFDKNPEETLDRYNAITNYQLTRPFSELAREYINIFQQWVDAAFCSVFQPVSDEEWVRLARRVKDEHFNFWFEAAAYYEHELTAAFHNASSGFDNYIRALRNSYDENRRADPGEIKASLVQLRLSINSVVGAISETVSHQDLDECGCESCLPQKEFNIRVQRMILDRIRPEFIPLLLG